MEESLKTAAPRTPLKLQVIFKKNYAREETQGILKNISLTGAFLEVNSHALRPLEKINITLSVAGRKRKLAAHIVWTNKFGCGLKFIPQNNRDIQIVDDLIYFVESERSESRSLMDSIFKKVI
jgi:hypothetical protein